MTPHLIPVHIMSERRIYLGRMTLLTSNGFVLAYFLLPDLLFGSLYQRLGYAMNLLCLLFHRIATIPVVVYNSELTTFLRLLLLQLLLLDFDESLFVVTVAESLCSLGIQSRCTV